MADSEVLLRQEKELLALNTRQNAGKLDKLIADEFIEISQSGTRYGKKEVLESLTQPGAQQTYEATNFQVSILDNNIAQVTYETTSSKEGLTRAAYRSSLWKRYEASWKIIFHQGTPKK